MSLLNNFKKHFFYRQHPEAAIRYGPIVRLLKKLRLSSAKILEVGSGSYGIAPYLKKPLVGVDTDFSEPEYPLLRQVKSSGVKLPFEDNAFEVVILSDVLEHIPGPQRKKTLDESIRVAQKVVIVSGPFGKSAARQDQYLAKYSIQKTGSMHAFFKDHLEYGLPEVNDIRSLLKKNQKVKSFRVVGEYFNLGARAFLMKFFITKSKIIYYFYLKGLMIAVPLFKRLNKNPCYRTLILIELN